MAARRPEMFSPHFVEFFVSAGEPAFCRSLKLEILAYVANASNIHKILREFNVRQARSPLFHAVSFSRLLCFVLLLAVLR
jgi:hypothetical protein